MAGLETWSFEQSLNNEKLINEIVKNPKNLWKEREDRSKIEELLEQSKSTKDTYSIFLWNTEYIFKNGEISKDWNTEQEIPTIFPEQKKKKFEIQEKSIVKKTKELLEWFKDSLNDILKPKNKENTPSDILSQEAYKEAGDLNDSIQADAKKKIPDTDRGYNTPPSDVKPDKDWNKSEKKNNIKPKWWVEIASN